MVNPRYPVTTGGSGFNDERLHGELGDQTTAEVEATYHRHHPTEENAA